MTEEINIDNVIKGYITGFFDAEGMVSIRKDGTLTVLINQTYKPVLEKIDIMFRSPSGIAVHSRGTNGRKDAFRWRVTSDKAVPFLEYVNTYSFEKKKQIELALKYQKEVRNSHRDNRSGGMFRLSQVEVQQREYFINILHNLKHELADESTLKNYDNEIKKLKIPKSVRDGIGQMSLLTLEEHYRFEGIEPEEKVPNDKECVDQKDNIPEMPSDVHLGYLAGFFDGEGYIGISKGHRDSYTLRLALTNSNFKMLQVYEKHYGGKIRVTKKKKDEHHKIVYQWGIDHVEALKFLETIYPYSVVKRTQIETAIIFQRWHNEVGVIKTLEQKQRAEWIYNKLKELKQETGEIYSQESEYESNIEEVKVTKFKDQSSIEDY